MSDADTMALLETLARTQGKLQACEEIIARTRALTRTFVRPPETWAGTPLNEGCVPVREILTALGPEPTDD